jgi:DNA-binding phage protein
MNRRWLASLTRGNSQDAMTDCPSDETFAAYLDGALEDAAAAHIESHLAECTTCRSVAAVAARTDDASNENVPETLVARARRRLAAKASRHAVVPAWAMAATVLLAVGLLAFSRTNSPQGVDVQGFDFDPPTTRGERLVDRRSRLPEITAPASDALVDGHDFAVRWKPVSGARYYEVRIVDDDGDLVSEARVNGTDWTPVPLDLVAGGDYFVRVDAYADSAKPRSSAHVPFKVAK